MASSAANDYPKSIELSTLFLPPVGKLNEDSKPTLILRKESMQITYEINGQQGGTTIPVSKIFYITVSSHGNRRWLFVL